MWVFHVIEKFCVLKTRLQSSDLRLNYENIASIKTTHVEGVHLTLPPHKFSVQVKSRSLLNHGSVRASSK